MFRAPLCSSSGVQLCEYNFWYNHSVLVAVRYRTATKTVGYLPEESAFIVRQYYVNSKLPVSTEVHPQSLYKYTG